VVDDIQIALTIDDLPWHSRIPHDQAGVRLSALAHALRNAEVPVTGFVVGGRDGLVSTRTWLEQGFELGNHTYSHKGLSTVSHSEFIADIERNERAVLDVLGHDLRGGWFRYPYLDRGEHRSKRQGVAQTLGDMGNIPAHVSINTRDYAFAREFKGSVLNSRLTNMYIRHVHECLVHFVHLGRRLFHRDIPHVLLLHANELNTACIGPLIAFLRDQGCCFIPLGNALRDPAYQAFDEATVAPQVGSLGDMLGDLALSKKIFPGPDPASLDSFRRSWQPRIHAATALCASEQESEIEKPVE
jgi:peptidoglycan/xylan/chitin deacetylase (PgdA/CDA1 family)